MDKNQTSHKIREEYTNITKAPYYDCLTSLFNHGIFQLLLDEEVKKTRRYGDIFTLAMIDIDRFSIYNQKFNNAVGDNALKALAEIIKNNTRSPDIASRFSGDIFAVLLPKSDLDASFEAMERLRLSVEKEMKGAITISIGMASCPAQASTRENIVIRAMEALTTAKVEGKNRIHFFGSKKALPISSKQPKILVVDDEPKNIKLIEALLSIFNYKIFKASSGEDALYLIKKTEIDLILLDVMMEGMDGFEVCQRIKSNNFTRMIPVVMLTALDQIEARIKGIEAGADDFITKPPNKKELIARIKALLRVNTLNKKLTSIENVLISMANTVEAKDSYTKGHAQRVARLAVEIGKKLNLPDDQLDALWYGGILHDFGKISVPRAILNKPTALTKEEFEIIKEHPVTGYNICLPLKNTIGPALQVIRHHHEKLDGSGYPDAIKGDQIPVLARIMAVVDIFDALDTDRPYNKSMPKEKTIKVLREEAFKGKIDQEIVKVLIQMIN